MRRVSFIFVILVLSFQVTGCIFGKSGRPLTELSKAQETQAYKVKAGDTLRVDVWGESRLSGEVLVRKDGNFTLQLVNDVPAAGKSVEEITTYVTSSLAQYVPGASVSVSVIQSAPIKYYLMGSFMKPGEYQSEVAITLLQAIATGQGFAPFANESEVVLIRKATTGEFRYTLDYNRVIEGKEPNPELHNGDTIIVR